MDIKLNLRIVMTLEERQKWIDVANELDTLATILNNGNVENEVVPFGYEEAVNALEVLNCIINATEVEK